MALDQDWITEICEEGGSAFSLKGLGKVFEEQSPFQKIEVFDTDSYGKLMMIDGCTMVSSYDNFLYHEMMSHPVLYSHPSPRRVAIIGGGDCGTLHEVLKHPEVDKVTQIDIDEQVTRAAKLHFPELCESNEDPRAELLFIDGIQWMKDAAPASLDVIIVDSTDPIGPGEMLFSPQFYGACHRALADDGLIVQQSESPLIHQDILERMYRDLLGASFQDVRTLFFPQPIYPTGWWTATIGAKNTGLDNCRTEDIISRTFETRYYNEEIHHAAFAQPEFFRRLRSAWLTAG
jgi:spermidine synthase